MGVVFAADDSLATRRCARSSAGHFASDPDRLSRFRARSPGPCLVESRQHRADYGLEQVEGSTCIVMELVEGETLADD